MPGRLRKHAVVALGLALIIGVAGAVIALTVGIDVLAGWTAGLLMKPPLPR